MSRNKFATLRARGKGYSDTYTDTYVESDSVVIVPHKFGFPTSFSDRVVSSPFQYDGELEGHPAIWAAVGSAWAARHDKNSAELITSMNGALDAAGFLAIGGGSLV